MKEFTAISLFCGAGGLDIGFERAGFRTIWANDIVADGNFASIGTTTNKFGGIFDGQGHTITINVGSGSEYQGLIGCAENAAC